MNCPRCNASLEVSQRQGVEIDRCPSCRGVWLDRGELDKIINRYERFDDDDDDNDHDDDDRYRDRREYREHHHSRRRSFWQELFD